MIPLDNIAYEMHEIFLETKNAINIKGDNRNTYKDRSTKRDDDKEEKADH